MTFTHNVDTANTVAAGNSVGSQKDVNRVGDSLLLAVLGVFELDGNTLLEVDSEVLGLVRSSHGVLGQLPHVGGRSGVGVLQDASLVRAVSEVLIHTPRLGLGGGDGDALLGGIVEEVVTADETLVEYRIAPRGDYLDVGLEGVEGKLEADLIVALAGTAVGDGEASLALWRSQESTAMRGANLWLFGHTWATSI